MLAVFLNVFYDVNLGDLKVFLVDCFKAHRFLPGDSALDMSVSIIIFRCLHFTIRLSVRLLSVLTVEAF